MYELALIIILFVIQGIDEGPDGLKLISDIIREKLEIEVSVLMGANIASEVADEKFCETTIGQTPFFIIFIKLFQHSAARKCADVACMQEGDLTLKEDVAWWSDHVRNIALLVVVPVL